MIPRPAFLIVIAVLLASVLVNIHQAKGARDARANLLRAQTQVTEAESARWESERKAEKARAEQNERAAQLEAEELAFAARSAAVEAEIQELRTKVAEQTRSLEAQAEQLKTLATRTPTPGSRAASGGSGSRPIILTATPPRGGAPTAAGASGRWRELVRFSGTANQTTPEFAVPNPNWRIRWSAGRTGEPGSAMHFAATVIGAETFDVAKTTKPGIAVMSGGGVGTYQVDVASSDARWEVVIEYR